MPASKEFERELMAEFRTQNLFRFAMSMTKSRAEAEDLVQETCRVALERHEDYQLGTNMKAWLFKLQAHINNNNRRKAHRQRVLSQGAFEDPETAMVPPAQLDRIMFGEADRAIEDLPIDQKEALYLVFYDGKTYDEAADILACSAGTVKSRVFRARARIAEVIHYEPTSGSNRDLSR